MLKSRFAPFRFRRRTLGALGPVRRLPARVSRLFLFCALLEALLLSPATGALETTPQQPSAPQQPSPSENHSIPTARLVAVVDPSQLDQPEHITSGILEVTRQKAISLAAKFLLAPRLSTLRTELLQSEVYLSRRNIEPEEPRGNPVEVSEDRRYVLVTTEPRPGAPTLFFPMALLKSENDLVRLHLCEALRRALPEGLRSDGALIADIATIISDSQIPIVTAESRIEARVQRRGPASAQNESWAGETAYKKVPWGEITAHSKSKDESDSEDISYFNTKEITYLQYGHYGYREGLSSLDRFDFQFHPFGRRGARDFAAGIHFGFLRNQDRQLASPIEFSIIAPLAEWSAIKWHLWMQATTYSLSGTPPIPPLRDTMSLGLSVSTEFRSWYTKASSGITSPNQTEYPGNISKWIRTMGPVGSLEVGTGVRWRQFSGGVRALGLYSTGYSDSGIDHSDSNAGMQFISVGPELSLQTSRIQWNIFGETQVQHSQNVNLDSFGDVMNRGSGQGYVGSSLLLRL